MRSSDWSSDVCSSDLEAVCSRGLSGASPSPDITSDHATTGPTPNVRADDRRDSMDATFYAEHLLAARRPGHSLPQGLYSDAAIFDLDVSLIYRREWLFAGHTCEVPEAGDFLTLRVGAAEAVIVRGADGVVRAFHNTCRPRRSEEHTSELQSLMRISTHAL